MKLLSVQVLRAVAAFSVATLHAQHEAGLFAAATGRAFTPVSPVPWQAGVDVFFVISGFVMVYSSRALFAATGARSVFLARRVARVVPLYWLTSAAFGLLAVSAPSLLNTVDLSPGYLLASVLFWPATRPDGLVQPLYSLGWTLNYEMFFYGLFWLALGLPRRAAVASLVLGLSALAGVGRLASWPQPIAFWSEPIVLEFAAGALLGLARTEGHALARPARIALLLGGVVGFVLVGGVERGGLDRALLWGVPASCLVAGCGLGSERPADGRDLLVRVAVALGDASYALYLTHPFAIRGLRELLRAAGLASLLPPPGFVVAGLAAAGLAAIIVHLWVERPLTRAARRLLGGLVVPSRPAGVG